VAKEKTYTVKVYTVENKITKGTLSSVDEKGVYVIQRTGDRPIFIDALQIKEIKLRRKGKSGTGTTIGFVTGLAIGIGSVVALNSDDQLENTLHDVGAAVFTFLTTAIGGAIGSRYDETISVNGRTEDYLQALQRLKGFAPASSSR
jgi:hypothetical protein